MVKLVSISRYAHLQSAIAQVVNVYGDLTGYASDEVSLITKSQFCQVCIGMLNLHPCTHDKRLLTVLVLRWWYQTLVLITFPFRQAYSCIYTGPGW